MPLKLNRWWLRPPGSPVAIDAAGREIGGTETTVDLWASATIRALNGVLGIAALLVALRLVAPLWSLEGVKAGIGAAGLPSAWVFIKHHYRDAFGSLAGWLRARGINLDMIKSRIQMPEFPPIAIPLQIATVAAAYLLYQHLQPVQVIPESGHAVELCRDLTPQQYSGEGSLQPQGTGSTTCQHAFARQYQRVKIRTGLWPKAGSGRLTIAAENGLIVFVLYKPGKTSLTKSGPGVVASSSVEFLLADDLHEAARDFDAYFVVEGRSGSTIQTSAALSFPDDRRTLDVEIPATAHD